MAIFSKISKNFDFGQILKFHQIRKFSKMSKKSKFLENLTKIDIFRNLRKQSKFSESPKSKFFAKKFRFWWKLKKISKNVDFSQISEKISILVELFQRFRFRSKLTKKLDFLNISKNVDFSQIFRKNFVLVIFWTKLRFWSKFSKNFDFFENFEKFRFWSNVLEKSYDFGQKWRKFLKKCRF